MPVNNAMEVERAVNVDSLVAEAMAISLNTKNASGAVDLLLPAEKQTRMAGDFEDNAKITGAIAQICFDNREWQLLNDNVTNLSKKRGLIKQSIGRMFQKCLDFVEQVSDQETKVVLLKCIRSGTEGKVYVEAERARATRILAALHERDGQKGEAFELMQEVAVETFSSVERREKYDFILEQMRLALDTEQYNQAQIISRKINPKIFTDAAEELQPLKVKYATLMIRLNLHFTRFLECAKACRSIAASAHVDNDRVFTEMIIFLLLAPFDREQHEMINQVLLEKRMKSFPIFADLVRIFLKRELINWSTVEAIVTTNSLFSSEIFAKENWVFYLQKRVVEHNVRIMAELYSRISLKRMAELLGLEQDAAELTLTGLINAQTVAAKIDRLDGIVTFTKNDVKNGDEHALLNQWSSQLDSLLTLMVKTNHMIAKEEMTQNLIRSKN